MALENTPIPPIDSEEQPTAPEVWVTRDQQNGSYRLASKASAQQIATALAQRARPEVSAIDPNPQLSEGQIHDLLHQYTSERAGAVTGVRRRQIADALRNPQGE